MSEAGEDYYRGLWWEWFAARVVFVLGFGVPIAAIVTLLFLQPPGQTAALNTQQAAGDQFCAATVAVAQSFGVVPSFARPTGQPQPSDVRGRYVCSAATTASKYAIAVDLMCRNLRDARCFNLFSVTQDDGTVIYQRQG